MFRKRDAMIQYKSTDQIELMRAAGLVVADALEAVRAAVAPGVTTGELDAIAERTIRSAGAVPSFLGYGVPPFPGSICASVNEQIVHGIPGGLVLREGDVVSVDCGAILAGWHGDSAVTVAVGAVDPEVTRLLEVCEDAMWRGLAAARAGGHVSDIGAAVERYVRDEARAGYGIVQEYVGHGIGTEMHQDPAVPNYAHRGRSPKLVPGLALAVEPMLTLRGRRTRTLDDDWTVVTADGAPAAHFEHTVAVTEEGPWVLTAADGGASRFAGLGVMTPAGR